MNYCYYYNSLIIEKQNNEKDFEAADVIKETLYNFVAEYVDPERMKLAETLFKGVYPEGRNADLLTFLFLRDDSVCGKSSRLNPAMSNKEFLCKLAIHINEELHKRGLAYPVTVNIERENLIMNFSKMDFYHTPNKAYAEDCKFEELIM